MEFMKQVIARKPLTSQKTAISLPIFTEPAHQWTRLMYISVKCNSWQNWTKTGHQTLKLLHGNHWPIGTQQSHWRCAKSAHHQTLCEFPKMLRSVKCTSWPIWPIFNLQYNQQILMLLIRICPSSKRWPEFLWNPHPGQIWPKLAYKYSNVNARKTTKPIRTQQSP